ncbi:carboxylesterase/lipase family protein [Streptomyces sp. NPDC059909]|uniref:carboxylesterase/lipase family protein n=1 Tax=Streptomyces sp. NPDC059909 TaxID=3346998 RepID=UPI0036667690
MGATATEPGGDASVRHSDGGPIVTIDGGAVRGTVKDGGYAFHGLPYAAAPTGQLRWKAPQPAADWKGVRDATGFAPSCPQPMGLAQPGPTSEDCLYLNVSTPKPGKRHSAGRPVLVWIHGGGLVTGAGREYDPTKLAAEGTVVVTVNYRLGALGFLSHPVLASRPGAPSGNYGLMDQQAALRWVQHNIGRFGGDPRNVTISGESAGGLSVLAHLTSPSSRGLFHRAIVQSGTFALKQQPLATAQTAGQAFAAKAGCTDQTAKCLRDLPAANLVNNWGPSAIPGVVDGRVLKESIGTSLAAGRFARVPILNGMNREEERVFVTRGGVVSGGFLPLPQGGVTAENYERTIASVLGVSDARAKAVAQEYPLSAYPSPTLAFSAVSGDASFACSALQVNKWTSKRVPTFAYEFNDDQSPARYFRLDPPPVATHGSEVHYLFDLPDAPFQDPFSADQEKLSADMRAAWANFAAGGNPSTAAVPWLSFHNSTDVMSLVPPQPEVEKDFAAKHHCSFWAAG